MEAEAAAGAKRKRRLPRGTSDYQAAWILDDRWDGWGRHVLVRTRGDAPRGGTVRVPAFPPVATSPCCCCLRAGCLMRTCTPPPLRPCSDLDDTDLESEGEEEEEGAAARRQGGASGAASDEDLPDLEPGEDGLGPGGSSFRDVDTGTEFGMDVSGGAAGP